MVFKLPFPVVVVTIRFCIGWIGRNRVGVVKTAGIGVSAGCVIVVIAWRNGSLLACIGVYIGVGGKIVVNS